MGRRLNGDARAEWRARFGVVGRERPDAARVRSSRGFQPSRGEFAKTSQEKNKPRVTGTVGVEVVAGVVEEAVQGLATVVAGDVGVEVEPDALDAVMIGAVWRKEVQYDAPVHASMTRLLWMT